MEDDSTNSDEQNATKGSTPESGSTALPEPRSGGDPAEVRHDEAARNPNIPSNYSSDGSEATEQSLTVAQGASWDAGIPPPYIFYAYSEEDRQHWINWNNAGTVDESKRLDKFTEAAIANSKFQQWVAAGSVYVLLAFSGVSAFYLQDRIMTGIFLGLPAVKLILGMFNKDKGD